MRFTIITPTVLRPTLVRTCTSIEIQTHKDWQHICIIDRPDATIPADLKHPQRQWIVCPEVHGYVGNRCRNSAFNSIEGDYVLYLDDDDWHINDTMAKLAGRIKGEDWGVFPALRIGNLFYNPVPGKCSTMSCQFYHKPVVGGEEMRYPTPECGGADGDLLNRLLAHCQPVMREGLPPLSEVDVQHFGKRWDFEDLSYEQWRSEYGHYSHK